jgi:hypothetical protein
VPSTAPAPSGATITTDASGNFACAYVLAYPRPIPSGLVAVRNDFWVVDASTGAVVSQVASEGVPPPFGLIQQENRRKGTTAWQLTNPADNRQIEGYASLTSVPVGGDIDLFVNTRDKTYSLTAYRMGWYGGTGGRQVLGSQRLPGVQQVTPAPPGPIECHWTNPFHLHVPTSWLSGIYLVKLHGNTSGKESYIIFTVRDSRHADLVFQQSVITYQAYNPWPGLAPLGGTDGNSLYNVDANGVQVSQVSFSRPYGTYPADDPFYTPPMFYSRQFARYGVGAGDFLRHAGPPAMEFGMLRWLEHQGYDVTYITDVDTHEDVGRLLRGKGFLSIGHDEYWSQAMRANVIQARDAGVSLGFFGGNYLYWAVNLLPDSSGTPNRTISLVDPTKKMTFAVMGMPEQSLVGGNWVGSVPTNGDIVVNPRTAPNDAPLDHWAFANTGLKVGDVIPGLIGVEYNGTDPNGIIPQGLQTLVHTQAPRFDIGLVTHGGLPIPANFNLDFNAWYDAGGIVTTVFDASTTTPQPWNIDDTTLNPPASEPTGSMAYDTATVVGQSGVVPTGTVVYRFFTNGTCTAPATSTETVTLAAGVVPNSATTASLPDSEYSYRASYSGDANHMSSTGGCEPFSVGFPNTSTAGCEQNPIPPLNINPPTGFCSNAWPVFTGARIDWAMTIYQAGSGAWVFNAATNQWSWGLDDYYTGLATADGANNGPALRIQCGYPWFHPGLVSCRNPAIEQITRNVLNRFITG